MRWILSNPTWDSRYPTIISNVRWVNALAPSSLGTPLANAVMNGTVFEAAVGWLLAAYHNMIYAGWIPTGMQPCSQGVSCSEEHIALFGFVSIPLLSLFAFTALVTILIVMKRGKAA